MRLQRIYIHYGLLWNISQLYLRYSDSNTRSDMINIYNDYLNVYKVLHCLYQASFSSSHVFSQSD